jgi:hypothetical protein
MRRRMAIALFAWLPFTACGASETAVTPTTTSTTQAAQDSSAVATPDFLIAATPAGSASTPCPALGFDEVGAPGATVTTYTKCGFTVTATTTNWAAWTGYGNPAPFIGFISAGGVTGEGEVRVTSAAGTFTFQSVDIYSSTTKIPYVITGLVNSAAVFTIEGTQPNTFGKFATVTNPNATALVDTLVIRLTNPAAVCCANPVGLDNIAVK